MLYYSKNKYNLSLLVTYGPYIDMNRECLVESAKEMEPDYILFLDDDQTYPKDTPEILLNHNKQVVGGVTPIKLTGQPMLWDYVENGEIKLWLDFNGNSGLTKVDGMGMGGVMIDYSVFDKLEPPYFKIQDIKKAGSDTSYRGEDITFYKKCMDAGIDVWADLDLRFGHLSIREIRLARN